MNNQSGLREKAIMTLEDPYHSFQNYLSGLSHDIRTPLSAIIGFSDLLAEQHVSRADQRSYCLMIARSSRKLLHLMSNLIDLAKMDTGNIDLNFRKVFFRDLVEEIKIETNDVLAIYEKANLSLSYLLPEDPSAFVISDKGRLLQILNILMENSLRFTIEGRISLSIMPGSPSGYLIEVSDTGSGMDVETLDNLFELFPLDSALTGGKIKARGMSLHVVKKLCEMMDIGIDVTSKVGAGTVVRLTVPFKAR